MMALILKFLSPSNGDIFIDNKNLNSINTKDLSNIALVQQQPFYFQEELLML